jgi:hypothetical protein
MSNLIHQKMIAILRDVPMIGKNQRNVKQNFNFRGIDTVYNELHGILAKHGVFTTSEILAERSEERQSHAGGCLIYRILTIKYNFFAEDGSSVSSTVIGEGMDSGDKASNKAMAVAHKYTLLQAFAIPTDDLKDPDFETHEVAPRNGETKSAASLPEKSEIDDKINALIKANGMPNGFNDWQSWPVPRKREALAWMQAQIAKNNVKG